MKKFEVKGQRIPYLKKETPNTQLHSRILNFHLEDKFCLSNMYRKCHRSQMNWSESCSDKTSELLTFDISINLVHTSSLTKLFLCAKAKKLHMYETFRKKKLL